MAKVKLSLQEAFSILELPYGASWDDIRTAYRKLAKKYHPDVSTSANAKDRFAQISIAYERLEDWEIAGRPSSGNYNSFAELRDQAAREARQKAREEAHKRELRKRVMRMRAMQDAEAGRRYKQAFVLVIACLLLYFGSKQGMKWYKSYRIENNKGETYATVFSQTPHFVKYIFVAQGKRMSKEVRVDYTMDDNQAENGLPILLEGRYKVTYAKDDPSYHMVDFNIPDLETLEVYKTEAEKIVRWRFRDSFIDMTENERKRAVHCLSLVFYEHFGSDYIANMFYAEAMFMQNWSHNHSTFEDLIHEDEFVQCFQYCNLTYLRPDNY